MSLFMYICLTSALKLTSREGDRSRKEVPQRANKGRSPHKWRKELAKVHDKAHQNKKVYLCLIVSVHMDLNTPGVAVLLGVIMVIQW